MVVILLGVGLVDLFNSVVWFFEFPVDVMFIVCLLLIDLFCAGSCDFTVVWG